MSNLRVLSIQSHVVHGYVGNKSATFPLQLHGFDVDAINSVQLSNHTGYDTYKGQVLNEKDLVEIIEGLSANDLIKGYSHLLTGYTRNDTFLLEIVRVVQKLKQENPNLIFVCDPVLGDDGKLYVPEKLVSIYRDSVISVADVITPNQTELEVLSGVKVNNLQDAIRGIDILHKKGCKIIVVTSMEFSTELNQLFVLTSRNTGERALIQLPKLPAKFYGTGDLFAALFLTWITKSRDNISVALENTVATVTSVIKKTLASFKECSDNNTQRQRLELKLIQCQDDIVHPVVVHRSKKI